MLKFLTKNPLLIAILCFTVLISFLALNLRSDKENLRNVQQQNLNMSGQYLSELFLNTIDQNIMTLENLKGRIEETGGSYFDYWEYDARLILNQHPSFRLVEWIDSNGIIQIVEPEADNEEAIGLNILELDYRRDDWLQMKADSLTNLTQWTPLVQGGGAFLVDTPLFFNGDFQGSITAGMDFTESFNQIMIGREMYNVEISDDAGTVFYSHAPSPVAEHLKDIGFAGEIFINASTPRTWNVSIVPNTQFAASTETGLNAGVILRAFLPILFGVMVYFMLVSYRANNVIRKSLREKEILISEIHHRVKNNLAVVSSMIDIQLHDLDPEKNDTEDILRKTQGRIVSMAGVHELLYNTDYFDSIPLGDYILNMFDHLNRVYRTNTSDINLKLEIVNETLNINQAVPLGLLLNELITNSFKHAFAGLMKGEIFLSIQKKKETYRVTYKDNGIGFDSGKLQKPGSIGLTLIKTLLSQLNADFEFRTEEGFRLDFEFKEVKEG